MSSYDQMTKAELLAEAEAQGVEANESMTKAEIQAQLGPEQQDAPSQLVTTTMTKDYMGRSLVNASPGVSAATDYMGRSVIASNKDYMARNLVA